MGTDNLTVSTGNGIDQLVSTTIASIDQLAGSTDPGTDQLSGSDIPAQDGFSGVTGTHVTVAGVLDDIVPSDVEVISTPIFPSSGTFKIHSGGQIITVTYTGKTNTKFTGCTIPITTLSYNIGDKCELIPA